MIDCAFSPSPKNNSVARHERFPRHAEMAIMRCYMRERRVRRCACCLNWTRYNHIGAVIIHYRAARYLERHDMYWPSFDLFAVCEGCAVNGSEWMMTTAAAYIAGGGE